jgi:hypothetical protein
MRNARKVRIDCVLWNTDVSILIGFEKWSSLHKEEPLTCAKEERLEVCVPYSANVSKYR